MIFLALGRWNHSAGKRFICSRIWWKGHYWTPFVYVRRRYERDKKAGVTTAVTKTIEAHKNMAFARAEIVNGRFVSARLALETKHSRGTNTLHMRNISQLWDIIQATQELLLAIAEEIT